MSADAPRSEEKGQANAAGGMLGRLRARQAKRNEPSWQEIAQCLFFIVEAIDDYLYTDEYLPNGSTRTIYSGPNRAVLMGGEPPPQADVAAEWLRMVDPEDRGAYDAHMERLNRGESSEATYRMRGYDGVTRWLHSRTRPRHTDGRLLMDGIVSDVTRRVAAETALAEAERDLREQLKLNEFQAHHDLLTGLANRRMLIGDLETFAAEATEASPLTLMVLDLNGFKHYNDTYGHPAGDALLARMGKKLAAACGELTTCYRLGGDEFCVLHRGRDDLDAVTEAVSLALTETGEGFEIDASCGSATMPVETMDPMEALQVADQRLYARKRVRLARRGAQHEALLQALHERSPQLSEHTSAVADLAHATAARLGLEGDSLERTAQAALFHEIGKIAVPDAILDKPASLTPDERTVIETHTIIGERILTAAPPLRSIAKIVRSHHERWDGNGYPDGLKGEQTPIEARVVGVCDAFCAMTSSRPYPEALTTSEAVEELRRCAGSQFDPAVVDAFAIALADLAASGSAHLAPEL